MADLQPLPQTGNSNLVSPNPADNQKPGAPSNPAKALSVVDGTSTANSNSNLAHVCDITGKMKYTIAWISLQVKELIEAIRQAIQKLWASVSGTPFGDGASNIVTAIKGMVKQIQKLIDKAKEVQAEVAGYIQQLQQLLAYIQSLPARIAKFLTDCLSEVTSSIKDAIKNAQSIVDSQNGGNLSTANSSATTASTTLNTAQNTNTGTSSGLVLQIS